MALRLALDANRYVDFYRGVESVVNLLRGAREVFIPFIVMAELRAGFRKGTRAAENEKALNQFLQSPRVTALFADETTTHYYTSVFDELRSTGNPIPTNDIWIAALVLQHDLVLATRDQHFDRVSRLARC